MMFLLGRRKSQMPIVVFSVVVPHMTNAIKTTNVPKNLGVAIYWAVQDGVFFLPVQGVMMMWRFALRNVKPSGPPSLPKPNITVPNMMFGLMIRQVHT